MSGGGSSGHWKAADYAGAGAFVPALGRAALDLLEPRDGERILDVGCGDGVLSAEIAQCGAQVVGIDANADLLSMAAKRGVETYLCAAQDMNFRDEFDAAFSNAALHWMGEYREEVAWRLFDALKAGGRFVGEMGGEGNIAGLLGAIEDEANARGYRPLRAANWYPSEDHFAEIYATAGFVRIRTELVDRPTDLGEEGVVGWIRTFRSGWLDKIGMPADERDDFAAAVAARWGDKPADYKRLRFSMRKPD